MQVQKDLAAKFFIRVNQPLVQRDRLAIVRTRMADEDP
jgi:hypothetical protein